MRLDGAPGANQETLLCCNLMRSEFASLHRDVLRRVHVASDAKRDGPGLRSPFAVRPSSFGCPGGCPKLQELVQSTLMWIELAVFLCILFPSSEAKPKEVRKS